MAKSTQKPKSLPKKTERIQYIDLLRVVSTFFIVMIHTVYQSFDHLPVTSFEWNTLNVYDSLSRWAVPIFVMISGALFLGSDKPLKVIFRKNIVRLITAFFAWSVVYAIIFGVRYNNPNGVWEQIFRGHYHMWFVIMIIGLYLVTPILRKITESKELTKLFLILALIFAVVIPDIQMILGFFPDAPVSAVNSVFSALVNNLNMKLPLGYASFFVLGYALNKYDTSKKAEYAIYALGAAGAIYTIVATSLRAAQTNTAYTGFYNYTTFNVTVTAIAVFVFFKQHCNAKNADSVFNKFIRALSKYSFGVYLVHLAVIEFMNASFHLTPASFNPIFSTLIICISSAVISYLISAALNHIPVLKKYVV